MCNGGGCLINPSGGGWSCVVVPFTRPTNLERFLTVVMAGGLRICGGLRKEEDDEDVGGVVVVVGIYGVMEMGSRLFTVWVLGGSCGWLVGWSLPDVDW